MVDFQCKAHYSYDDFLEIMRLLRSPAGCPWDQEQTHGSIRRNFLEETYEVLDALDRDDAADMCEELGDVLMQVVFHAIIEEERGRFTMADVVDGVAQKMVYRHPHVFGGTLQADTSEQVLVNWEVLKKAEKGQTSTADAIEAVPHTLPALWRAEKVQKKAAKAGFDWPGVQDAVDKLSEEVDELRSALSGQGNPVEELGDLFFAAVCVSRFLNADPDDVLQAASDKFAARFRRVEALAGQQGRPMNEMTLEELKALWVQAKTQA